MAEAVEHVKKQASAIQELEKQNRELLNEARDLRAEKSELRQDKNYIREERDSLKAELEAARAELNSQRTSTGSKGKKRQKMEKDARRDDSMRAASKHNDDDVKDRVKTEMATA